MPDVNPYAAPQSDPIVSAQLVEAELVESGGGIWRDGRVLVMRKDAILPDRCVKCNAPAEGLRLKRSLYWHTPWLYLLILVSLWIYIIVALIVRQRAKIEIGVCARHLKKRRRSILICWLLLLFSGLLFGIGVSHDDYVRLILVALVGLLASLIWGWIISRIVVPSRIDSEYVWLKNIDPEFVGAFPSWWNSPYRKGR